MTDQSREGGGDPAVDEPRHKAFQAQRHRIKELERSNEDLQAKVDESDDSLAGDPGTSALRRQVRSLEGQVDSLLTQGIDEEQLEIAMAANPWLKTIPNKMDRIQAARKMIAVDQTAEINAGDSPVKGRKKSDAAAQAHLTGGGPPASGRSSRSDGDRQFVEYEKKMGEAKTQKERDALANEWSKSHPEDRPL